MWPCMAWERDIAGYGTTLGHAAEVDKSLSLSHAPGAICAQHHMCTVLTNS
jgi:hypothetical protein